MNDVTPTPSFLRKQRMTPRALDTGIQMGRGGVHAAPPDSGGGDLVEPAGGAIVYEAPNLVLQGDERAGLDA